jgi:predicted RNA binding protein YcfA (HicA-like mRNA interferase family)
MSRLDTPTTLLFTIPIKLGILDLQGASLMPISGKDMLKLYEKAGWRVKAQKGSHVKVEKNGQIQTIPMHKELAKGTEHALKKSLK